MTRLVASLYVLVFLAGVVCAATTKPEEKPDTPTARIGTFDSRAIAVAFVGSEVFNQYMADLKSRHIAAEAAGDKKKITELEKEGANQQKMLHKQGFRKTATGSGLHI